MNTVFVAAGPYSWGSSRMRAYWVAEKMGAAVVQFGRPLPDADTYVWQKSFDLDFIKSHQDKRHYWDVCDPIWWFSPGEVEELVHWIDGVVCSTKALAADLREWGGYADLPIITIDDRLDFAHFPIKRTGDAGVTTRFIWYGVAVNRVSLAGAMINLARLAANGHNIALTVFDDQPTVPMGKFDFPVYHIQWDVAKENAVIASHDIALLPPYPGAWGWVKSKNKHVTAWACGLPVTDGIEYDVLTDMVEQAKTGQCWMPDDLSGFDVALSAREWEAIVCHS